MAAGDLAVGDSIQTISGDAGIVTGLELEKLDRPIFVYNLDIEDFHSYFVADGVLVHNRCVVKENDVKIEYYPGDHDPLHFHVYGKGRMSKIDIKGNPLKGYKLTDQQRKVVRKHLDDLLKFIAGQ